MLSIIIPTYNERENISILIESIFEVLSENTIDGEVIVVDDNSPDGTAKAAEALKDRYNVRVIVRKTERGLSSAAIRGMKDAHGEVLCVMDADLSHPPDTIPRMRKPITEGKAELVIGSRRVKGGGIKNWPLKRKLVSRAAALISRPLTKVKDPMSGFFMLKKEVIEGVELKPKGYKIGLEIIVKGRYDNVMEVPYIFKDRAHGESKLSGKVIMNYLSHALRLYFYRDSAFFQFLKFCMVGGLGIFVDLGVFSVFYWGYFLGVYGQNTGTLYSQTISFTAAVAFNFVLNKVWTFRDKEKKKTKVTKQFFLFFAVAASAWAIRTVIIYFLLNYQNVWKFYSMPVITWLISLLSIERFVLLVAIIIVMLWNFFGTKYLVFKGKKKVIKSQDSISK